MFVMWAWINGLAGELHVDECPEDVQRALAREMSPALIFLQACDGKFTDEDLSAEGNAFAKTYYANEEGMVVGYLDDYAELFGDLPSTYHVPDTWESFEKVAPLIASRFNEWRAGSSRH